MRIDVRHCRPDGWRVHGPDGAQGWRYRARFHAEGSDGKTYKLADYRGKQAVVVAWFPKAFTQGCTIECKSLAANGELLKKYDVTYFMASVDPLEDNTKFGAEQADFPLLSDPTRASRRRTEC